MMRLSVDQLTPGLTLGKPVYNLNGVLLLCAGEVLSAKHLQIFKAWGIRDLDVVDEEGSETVAPDAPVPPELAAAVEREITRRFRRSDPGDPVISLLRQLVTRRLTVQLLTAARQRARVGR